MYIGSKTQDKGVPETIVCSILMFLLSLPGPQKYVKQWRKAVNKSPKAIVLHAFGWAPVLIGSWTVPFRTVP